MLAGCMNISNYSNSNVQKHAVAVYKAQQHEAAIARLNAAWCINMQDQLNADQHFAPRDDQQHVEEKHTIKKRLQQ